jgi:hypothetical protein
MPSHPRRPSCGWPLSSSRGRDGKSVRRAGPRSLPRSELRLEPTPRSPATSPAQYLATASTPPARRPPHGPCVAPVTRRSPGPGRGGRWPGIHGGTGVSPSDHLPRRMSLPRAGSVTSLSPRRQLPPFGVPKPSGARRAPGASRGAERAEAPNDSCAPTRAARRLRGPRRGRERPRRLRSGRRGCGERP